MVTGHDDTRFFVLLLESSGAPVAGTWSEMRALGWPRAVRDRFL